MTGQHRNPAGNNLAELRQGIDAVDERILADIAERFTLTHQVGILKAEAGLPAVDHAREEEQMKRIAERATEQGVSPEFAQSLWRVIIDQVVENHKKVSGRENE